MLFSFHLLKGDAKLKDFDKYVKFGEYSFCFDENTPFQNAVSGEREIVLYGYAVNLQNGNHADLCKELLKNSSDIASLLECEKNLGGKYLIFYKDSNGYYVIPDATASVPIYFYFDADGVVCSSHIRKIVNVFSLTPDKKHLKIRNSGDISQAMPYDITEYSEIKQLLPNHYLDFFGKKAVRFLIQEEKAETISASQAAKITAPLIKTLTNYYLSKCECMCAITGGRDSRVVLSSLINRSDSKVKAYTIKHNEMSDTNSDLVIPKEISKICDINYFVAEDINPTVEQENLADSLLGEDMYSKRTLMIANSVLSVAKGAAVINGDIIGQVGKCSLHRDIPQFLATPGYFRCKLHNYSKKSKVLLKAWLKDIKSSGEKVNTFDLFSVENRMGRWAAQENIIYNTLGQKYFNIFNSRSIIYVWSAVDRAVRKQSKIHIELIKLLNKELLKVNFEEDESILVKIAKSNGVFYYLFSRFKFTINKLRRTLR